MARMVAVAVNWLIVGLGFFGSSAASGRVGLCWRCLSSLNWLLVNDDGRCVGLSCLWRCS